MEKKWLYKVENDKISVLLSLIVTVIFAAVKKWHVLFRHTKKWQTDRHQLH